MRILKFGGTSMGDEHTWQRVIDIIGRYDRPFVIVSATARTTRRLVASAEKAKTDLQDALQIADEIEDRHHQLITNFTDQLPKANSDRVDNCFSWLSKVMQDLKSMLNGIHQSETLDEQTKDAISAIGERLSSYLFAQCCNMAGISAKWVDAADIIRTDSDYGRANPDTGFINRETLQLLDEMDPNDIPVMGGFYGRDSHNNTTTLGFEGSDYTASLVGGAIDAEAVEIWTDVSGIYTCDPRFVKNARPIDKLSYQEATELAYFGAKVLHPSTTKPAASKNIPLLVKNIFEPEAAGTKISRESENDRSAKAITFKENGIVLTVTSAHTVMGYEFLAGVFDILRYYHLPVDVVTTTEASVSIATEKSDQIDSVTEQLQTYGKVEIEKEQGIISLVGCRKTEIAKLVNEVVSQTEPVPINLLSFSRSKGNLNLVIDREQTIPVVRKIHKKLFEEN